MASACTNSSSASNRSLASATLSIGKSFGVALRSALMCYCWPWLAMLIGSTTIRSTQRAWTPKHGEPLSKERRRGPHKAVHTRHTSPPCVTPYRRSRTSVESREISQIAFPPGPALRRRNLWSLRLLFPKAIRMIHNHRMSTVQSVSHMSHCAATPRRATWVVATRPGVRYLLTCTHCAAAGRRWHSSGCGRGTSIANSLTSLHASTPCLPYRGLAN